MLKLKRYIPRQIQPFARNVYALWHRWVEPVVSFDRIITSAGLYKKYFADWQRYQELPNAQPFSWQDTYPCLFDATSTSGIDAHYFYQAVWAMDRIARSQANYHVDIGSDVRFISMLTTHLPVTFIDIRPLQAKLPALNAMAGNILVLPFEDSSVKSLSCMHVVEHIGLGRYGDALNPMGTYQACVELARVLARGGNLFFSTPVGRPRICFNAHRIHSPQQILAYFQELELVEFSGINDQGEYCQRVDPDTFANERYACGLFRFTKK